MKGETDADPPRFSVKTYPQALTWRQLRHELVAFTEIFSHRQHGLGIADDRFLIANQIF